jgi:hypothetical protein
MIARILGGLWGDMVLSLAGRKARLVRPLPGQGEFLIAGVKGNHVLNIAVREPPVVGRLGGGGGLRRVGIVVGTGLEHRAREHSAHESGSK